MFSVAANLGSDCKRLHALTADLDARRDVERARALLVVREVSARGPRVPSPVTLFPGGRGKSVSDAVAGTKNVWHTI